MTTNVHMGNTCDYYCKTMQTLLKHQPYQHFMIIKNYHNNINFNKHYNARTDNSKYTYY